MHMADALLSPVVGGAMWAATCGAIAYCSRRVRKDSDEKDIPLMGVLGAFVFAAQMINFTIPGTGSSGHLGGGMLLAILLGPCAAFLTIASILTVQALFFADGGLLALGCNCVNLGFFPCFVAYPLIYRPLVGRDPSAARIARGATLASVVGLQLGALGVVTETTLSGITELPFLSFLLAMQPIHLGIGIVEGVITAAVVAFLWKAQPGLLAEAKAGQPIGRVPRGVVLAGLLVAAAVVGGAFSWFASSRPDGLEWSILRVTGEEEVKTPGQGLHTLLSSLQARIAMMPDYGFREVGPKPEPVVSSDTGAWPAVDAGTSISGLVGGLLTLIMATLAGFALMKRARTG